MYVLMWPTIGSRTAEELNMLHNTTLMKLVQFIMLIGNRVI